VGGGGLNIKKKTFLRIYGQTFARIVTLKT
jgi:hypothetical protein